MKSHKSKQYDEWKKDYRKRRYGELHETVSLAAIAFIVLVLSIVLMPR